MNELFRNSFFFRFTCNSGKQVYNIIMVSTSVRALIPPKYIDVFREVKMSVLKPVETDLRLQKRLTLALSTRDKQIRNDCG